MDPVELTKIVKEIILGTCIASHGLTRLDAFKPSRDEEIPFEELYRAESSYRIPEQILKERIRRATKGDFTPLKQQGFTSTSQTPQAMKVGGTDTTVRILQPANNPMGKDVSHISYKKDEEESLFVPGVQFVYSEYKSEGRKTFQAVPVRSLDDIHPRSYSSKDAAIRNHLIEANEMLNKTLENTPKKSSFFKIKKSNEEKLFLLNVKLRKLIELFENSHPNLAADKKQALVSFYDEVYKLQKSFKGSPTPVDDLLTIVNKLGVEQELGDQSALINHAIYVYTHYLSKPYKETHLDPTDDKITIDGKDIYRPNHGLAHSLRVATYVPAVVDYF
ncbi:Uncharacterised protein [Legionella lansingensis]|uniref:SidE PDE domain-containing protein n=1 Tax=Legionella lansingensis TaxID=45067 RepID=A0A0W0VVC4_9GAMM|nr:hypothetical protein Llan_0634 [Legionella lansingensis]SNV46664.1 Uncharacterised protein [Legionella lansingensis]